MIIRSSVGSCSKKALGKLHREYLYGPCCARIWLVIHPDPVEKRLGRCCLEISFLGELLRFLGKAERPRLYVPNYLVSGQVALKVVDKVLDLGVGDVNYFEHIVSQIFDQIFFEA